MPDIREGCRDAMPWFLPTMAMGASFGALAAPELGVGPTIAMSLLVSAGTAQFAALGALTAGGSVPVAVLAGLMMNLRFLPLAAALAPSLPGRAWVRAVQGFLIADASLFIAREEGAGFNRHKMVGATIPQMTGWWSGSIIGAVAGGALDPKALGLDAIFPALFLVVLSGELRSGTHRAVAAVGGAITALMLLFAPPGLAIVAAAAAALIGLRHR